jgi:hypothetical protein
VAAGYLGNPLHPQSQINRIPLLTQADYAYNPWDTIPRGPSGRLFSASARTPSSGKR